MKKIFFVFFILLTATSTAHSADYAGTGFNYSYVDPRAYRPARGMSSAQWQSMRGAAINQNCPPIQWSQTSYSRERCDGQSPCSAITTGGSKTVVDTCTAYNLDIRDYYVTNLCYRPSCYYQAIRYADLGFQVQPLTTSSRIIDTIMNGLTDSKLRLTTSVNGIGGNNTWNVPTLHPSHQSWITSPATVAVKDGVDTKPQNSRGGTALSGRGNTLYVTTDIGTVEPGGGTSAIEGLLWSWHILSNTWKGVWVKQSSYEAAAGIAPNRADLPDKKNLKNIILISDGADTDGYSNGMTFPGTGASAYPNLLNESGVGFQFVPAPPSRSMQRENCDAHRPNTPVSPSDYQTLCDKLYEQGIRVHVILYGYSSNPDTDNKLKYCAERTRGLFFQDTSSAGLTTAFKEIFASIMAQNVRLVEK